MCENIFQHYLLIKSRYLKWILILVLQNKFINPYKLICSFLFIGFVVKLNKKDASVYRVTETIKLVIRCDKEFKI